MFGAAEWRLLCAGGPDECLSFSKELMRTGVYFNFGNFLQSTIPKVKCDNEFIDCEWELWYTSFLRSLYICLGKVRLGPALL